MDEKKIETILRHYSPEAQTVKAIEVSFTRVTTSLVTLGMIRLITWGRMIRMKVWNFV